MIYAFVRGWIAGMAAVFVEIIVEATVFFPEMSSQFPTERHFGLLVPALLIALIEESAKSLALRGISSETVPFFRNAIFKGLLVGAGFAAFEIGIKILFQGDDTHPSIVLRGSMSSGIFHIATGGILGTAWLFRIAGMRTFIFASMFLACITLHVLYNLFLSPFLFERFL